MNAMRLQNVSIVYLHKQHTKSFQYRFFFSFAVDFERSEKILIVHSDSLRSIVTHYRSISPYLSYSGFFFLSFAPIPT